MKHIKETEKDGFAMEKAYVPEYPLLCAPLRVGNVTLRSRMCSAPMGFPDLTEDGCLTEGAIAFYENRARGGAAIVTISEACVDYVNGKSHGRLINLCNPGVLAGLTNAARAIRRHGALLIGSRESDFADFLARAGVKVNFAKRVGGCRSLLGRPREKAFVVGYLPPGSGI